MSFLLLIYLILHVRTWIINRQEEGTKMLVQICWLFLWEIAKGELKKKRCIQTKWLEEKT